MPPIPVLADSAAGWGLANVAIDPDFEVRRLRTGNVDLPSVSWIAASKLGADITRNPASRLRERWLNYYCAPTALDAVNLDHALEADGLPKHFFAYSSGGGQPSEGGISGLA